MNSSKVTIIFNTVKKEPYWPLYLRQSISMNIRKQNIKEALKFVSLYIHGRHGSPIYQYYKPINIIPST